MHTLICLSLILAAAPVVVTSAPTARVEPLTIESAKGEQVFSVEVVHREKERSRGLMFRDSMANDRGMLFDYSPPQKIAFWMKNTFIPLDIIFIGADGRILNIAENTTPLSLERLPSVGEARGVLEINGGLSAKLGLKPGDKVHHAIFDPVQ
ncbi:MAG: DUF192 domain-containing protein [Alphaproteobacteria bacterium]|nr:DUF192 domain-containing protein [Alphaproteobacteria bacterium]